MTESNKETEVKSEEIRYCKIRYKQVIFGGEIEIIAATVPLDMDIYDSAVAYKDNLEYFIQGIADSGFCIINNDFIPWHNIDRVSPCREVGNKKKNTRRKPRKQQSKKNPKLGIRHVGT